MCVNHITSPLKFSVNLILMWFFTQWALELWNVFLNNAAGSEFYIMFKGRLDRYLEKGRGIYLTISKYTNPTRIWKAPEQKIVRGRDTISAKVQFSPFFLIPVSEFMITPEVKWVLCCFFPFMPQTTLLFFSLSSLVATLALQIQYLMIFIKTCFPCMGIHTYGWANCLSLTQK